MAAIKGPVFFPIENYLAHIEIRRNDSWNGRLPASFPKLDILSHGKITPPEGF
jgi:hypothetical protein